MWLLDHRCPESWNQQYVRETMEVLTAVAGVVGAVDGFVHLTNPWVLNSQIEGACERVDRLRSIATAVMDLGDSDPMSRWSLLTSRARLLVRLAEEPNVRLREYNTCRLHSTLGSVRNAKQPRPSGGIIN